MPPQRVLAIACSSLVLSVLLAAATARADAEDPRVAVTGTGRVSAPPDMARVHAGVVSEATRAADAVAANNAAMQKVHAALKEAGIDAKHVQTARFDVHPIYDQSEPHLRGGPPRITGYRAANQVQVKVMEVARVGGVLDALVASGANEIGGISFEIAEPAPLLDQARRLAVADARRKAELLAGEAGVALGRVVRIDESSGGGPIPVAFARMEAADAAVPIATGELDLTASVAIAWAIAP